MIQRKKNAFGVRSEVAYWVPEGVISWESEFRKWTVALWGPGLKYPSAGDFPVTTTHLTTVLSSVDLASLWNVMITLVAGKSSRYFFLRQLKHNSVTFNISLNYF